MSGGFAQHDDRLSVVEPCGSIDEVFLEKLPDPVSGRVIKPLARELAQGVGNGLTPCYVTILRILRGQRCRILCARGNGRRNLLGRELGSAPGLSKDRQRSRNGRCLFVSNLASTHQLGAVDF
jgi:hypothetical protein